MPASDSTDPYSLTKQPGSVSLLVSKLAAGDATAQQEIFDRYYQQLVGATRKRLGNGTRRVSDEEDVAITTFNTFFQGASGGNVRGDSAFMHNDDVVGQDFGIENAIADDGPTPEAIVTVAEQCEQLLLKLEDDELSMIATLKSYGASNVEIAKKLQRDIRTIERRLNTIRKKWDGESPTRRS